MILLISIFVPINNIFSKIFSFLLRVFQSLYKNFTNFETKIEILIMNRNINRIKTVLVDKCKTNKWLAEQLGKDPATISKWCTNACQPSIETLITISKLLKVDINDLVRVEEVPEPIIKKENI